MSRKKKATTAAPEAPSSSVETEELPAPPKSVVPGGFPAWLDTMTCTRPFTIADCTELHAMVKRDMPPGFIVDVFFDDTHVHVWAWKSRDTFVATLKRELPLL